MKLVQLRGKTLLDQYIDSNSFIVPDLVYYCLNQPCQPFCLIVNICFPVVLGCRNKMNVQKQERSNKLFNWQTTV